MWMPSWSALPSRDAHTALVLLVVHRHGHSALSRKEGPISLSLLLIMQVVSLVPYQVNKATVLSWWEDLWVGELQAPSATRGLLPHRCLGTPQIACCHQGGYPGHAVSSVGKSRTQLPHKPSHTASEGCRCWFLLLSLSIGRLPKQWLNPVQFPVEAALADTCNSKQSLRLFRAAGS